MMGKLAKTTTAIAAGLGALTLAGCGGGGVDETADGGNAPKVAEDWAKDACKTFPREAASGASGLPLTQEELSSQPTAGDVDVSTCTYGTADDKHFTVLLRQDRAGTSKAADQIAGLTGSPDMLGPTQVIAMPKGQAVWAGRMATLSYVPDDNRMIVVTPPGAIVFGGKRAPEADLKALAVKIATAIEDR